MTSFADRAAKMLEMLFATRTAGDRRTTYQALSRSASNAGIAIGAGIAALGLAELVRSVTSWELAVSMAPEESRPAYLGVAGMSQSVQKSAGPLLLTGAVITSGPAGWLVLGTAVSGLSLLQRRNCLRRLAPVS